MRNRRAINLQMRPLRQIIAPVVVWLLLYTPGCSKKPSQLPTQAKAPVETIPSSLPPEISEETPPEPPPPEPKQEEPPPEPAKPKPAQHHKKKSTTTTPPATTTAQDRRAGSCCARQQREPPPSRRLIRPQIPLRKRHPTAAIGADVNSAQLSQQVRTTAQLLDETEKTLNGLNHTLSHDQEEIVNQIRSYIGQSRTATKDGDFERAYNLATKAHLLSDALVKK